MSSVAKINSQYGRINFLSGNNSSNSILNMDSEGIIGQSRDKFSKNFSSKMYPSATSNRSKNPKKRYLGDQRANSIAEKLSLGS